MKTFSLFLLCCVVIMAAVLPQSGAQSSNSTTQSTDPGTSVDLEPTLATIPRITGGSSTAATSAVSSATSTSFGPTSERSSPSYTSSPTTTTRTTPASPGPQTTTNPSTDCLFKGKIGFIFLIVTGCLIVLCTLLLVSTVALTCHVCHLKKHVNSNADLISNHEYWMGTAQRNGGTPDAEAGESTVLMSHFKPSQAQEELSSGAAEEDAGKVKEDGKTGEEASETVKEGGDPAAAADQTSASETKTDTADSPSTKDTAAASSEGSEEPKDAV